MKKIKSGRSETITFNEFIDLITENRGDEIKRELMMIELNSKTKNIKKDNK